MEQANIIRRTYNSWLSEAILMNKSILPHARYTPSTLNLYRDNDGGGEGGGGVVVTPEQNRNDDGGGGDTRTKSKR